MKNEKVDKEKAMQQWTELKKAIENEGVEVRRRMKRKLTTYLI